LQVGKNIQKQVEDEATTVVFRSYSITLQIITMLSGTVSLGTRD